MAVDVEYKELTEEELNNYNRVVDNLSKNHNNTKSSDYYKKLESYTKKVLNIIKNDSKKTELFVRIVNKYMDNLKECHNYANQKEAYDKFVADLISVDILKEDSTKLMRVDKNKWLAMIMKSKRDDSQNNIEQPPSPTNTFRTTLDTNMIYFESDDDNNKFYNR